MHQIQKIINNWEEQWFSVSWSGRGQTDDQTIDIIIDLINKFSQFTTQTLDMCQIDSFVIFLSKIPLVALRDEIFEFLNNHS